MSHDYRRAAAAALGFLSTLCGTAGADEGMWLINRPPLEQMRRQHGFEPSADWLEHVQKSAVKIGASGSLVSPDGLLMTNHHVGSDQIAKLSTPQRDLLTDGFYAPTRSAELKCPDLEVKVLWSIEDVTERVAAAAPPDADPARAFELQRKAMTRIEQELKEKTGLDSQVVTLYHGARYHLYRYKRFTDVRLVFAPEKAVAFFGGDNDNFEYPRFDFDCCFFRVYENDQPLRPEHYLKWSAAGAAEGEPVFVLGHPGRTQRLFTGDHLDFLRDVDLPATLRYLWRREVQLLGFCNRSDDNLRVGEDELFGFQNSRKALTGVYAGLLDPRIMGGKKADEQRLRAYVNADPARRAQWGDAWERLARALEGYRTFFVRYNTLRDGRCFNSDLFKIALTLVRLGDELPKPSDERLREYRDSELDSVRLRLYSPAPIHDALEMDSLASGLSLLAELFGAEDATTVAALEGRSPIDRAQELVRGTKLRDVEVRRRLEQGGAAAVRAGNDPMIQLARALDAEMRALRRRFEDEVESVQRACYARIAAARFAQSGESVYPDATGTLRLSLGVIKGYREDDRPVPAFTTLAGMYQRSAERRGMPPFCLPQRWQERKARLALDTPMNFVCTADIIGGNSGSPVVNRAGEVVGLIFDGNLQSLAWDVAFDEAQARALALDSRAVIEALRKVYDAGALADELVGKPGVAATR